MVGTRRVGWGLGRWVLVGVVSVLAIGPSGLGVAQGAPPAPPAVVASLESFADVERIYGVKVVVPTGAIDDPADGYRITGRAAKEEELAKYRALFLKEWALYPARVLEKAKVKRIVVGAELNLNGQPRAAVPAFDLDAMYYDAVLGSHSPNYQRVVVHHEFFHMIDERMGVLRRDREWSALNPKGFAYGSGGHRMRTSGVGQLTDKIPGFLTPYGTAAVEEDKAELFAHLVVNGEFVRERAKQDPVLAQKIDLLKKRLEKFMPEMGAEFWKQVEARSAKA